MIEKPPLGRGLDRIEKSMREAGIPDRVAQVLTEAIPGEHDYDIHVLGAGEDVALGPIDPKVKKLNERLFPDTIQ